MSDSDFEDNYMDVLQNIEAGIISVYNANPNLTDHEVDSALETLYKSYRSEVRGRKPTTPRNPMTMKVYQAAQGICEWRLGRDKLLDGDNQPVDIPIDPLTVEEITACLKWIRKSIRLWTKEGGRQGYLNYISQFIL